MTFLELLKQEHISPTHRNVSVLQKFYQEGFLQGTQESNPNYDYSIKYKAVVERILKLFNDTVNPFGLELLEKCLDNMDTFRKENLLG
jgi:hypothetical protein